MVFPGTGRSLSQGMRRYDSVAGFTEEWCGLGFRGVSPEMRGRQHFIAIGQKVDGGTLMADRTPEATTADTPGYRGSAINSLR